MLRQIAGVFTSEILISALGAITSIGSARLLGPEQRGVLVVALLITGLAHTLTHLGLFHAVVYNLSRAADVRDTLRQCLTLCIRIVPWMLLGTIGLYAAAYPLGRTTLFRGVQPALALSSCLLCMLQLIHLLVASTLIGLQDFRWRNTIRVLPSLFTAGVLVCFWLSGAALSPLLLMGSHIVARAVSAGLGAGYIALKYRPVVCWRLPADWMPSYLGYGLKLYTCNVAQMANCRLDTLILNALMGSATVGLYSAGVTLAELVLFIPTAVDYVLYPRIAALPEGERDRVTALTLGASLYLVLGSSVGLAILLPWILPLLFGKAFAAGVPAAYWLLPGMLALTVFKVLSHVLAGSGRPEYPAYTAVIGLFGSVPLYYLLIPRFSMLGAAWASSLAYALSALVIFGFYTGLRATSRAEFVRSLVVLPVLSCRAMFYARPGLHADDRRALQMK
jgi:O-antigen/teichoic acid export membrane protein